MQVQSVSSQNFRGLQCHPNFENVQYIIAKKMTTDGFCKAMDYMEKIVGKKSNVEVYIAGDLAKDPKIYAEVGGKLFKENFFNSPLRVLKKACRLARRLDEMENQKIADKVMNQ